MRKFDDPSKAIYYDSLHKKQNGVSNGSAFLLGNIPAANGQVCKNIFIIGFCSKISEMMKI